MQAAALYARPVLFRALVNPGFHFSPQEWKAIAVNDLDGCGYEDLLLERLTQVSDIMQRGRIGLGEHFDFQTLVAEANYHYCTPKAILSKTHECRT